MNEVMEVQQQNAMPVIAQATPMQMLSMAVAKGVDIDQLTKLMDLQERWEKNEAKKAFLDAKAAFSANPPAVYKDKDNKQYGSKYSSIGNLVNTVNEELSKHGLSTSWNVNQTEGISVTCVLTHRMGHSESCSMTGPQDSSGSKNPLQQIKSTVTYLKISTFEAVTGIASLDGNADDDGNGYGKKEKKTITPTSGLWEALDDKTRSRLTDLVVVTREYLVDGDVNGAVTAMDSAALDTEEKAAIWTQFDSKSRSAMKRAKQEMAMMAIPARA